MQASFMLLSFAFGLLSLFCTSGADHLYSKPVENPSAGSANNARRDSIPKPGYFKHRRSGAYEQPKAPHVSRQSKRQSDFDPASFVSNAVGGSNEDEDSMPSNTGGSNDSNGPPSNGTTTGTPASNSSPPNSAAPSNAPSGTASGNCNTNVSPNGCANENGPATGNPGWTCDGSSQPSTRDLLTSSRLSRRQSTPSYVATMNSWRCKFCLPPYTYDPSLEQSAQTQSNNAASAGSMVENPPTGQGTIMARGTGPDFQTAVLFWLCEVHTTNMDSCQCANVYSQNDFEWTERGHYDYLVGKQASEFGSIGCVYNDALGGLWTCALGMT